MIFVVKAPLGLSCVLHVLGLSATAEIKGNACLLVRQQHLEVKKSAPGLQGIVHDRWWQVVRCPGPCHTGSWTLWLEQPGSSYLSIKEVCSCFPACWLQAEMCWSSLMGALPMSQDVVRAHAHRSACNGRQRAGFEALDVQTLHQTQQMAPGGRQPRAIWSVTRVF